MLYMPIKNIDERRKYAKINQRNKRKRLQKEIRKIKMNSCCNKCGWDKHPEILMFHHKDKKNKSMSIASMLSYVTYIEDLKKEIAKCILLCPNCHSWIHSKDKKFFKKSGTRGGLVIKNNGGTYRMRYNKLKIKKDEIEKEIKRMSKHIT